MRPSALELLEIRLPLFHCWWSASDLHFLLVRSNHFTSLPKKNSSGPHFTFHPHPHPAHHPQPFPPIQTWARHPVISCAFSFLPAFCMDHSLWDFLVCSSLPIRPFLPTGTFPCSHGKVHVIPTFPSSPSSSELTAFSGEAEDHLHLFQPGLLHAVLIMWSPLDGWNQA